MALFKKRDEEAPPLADETQAPKATTPDWNAPASQRAGAGPRGFKISNLEFGSTGNGGQVPALERLGLGELMNATAFDNADLKANHIEPGVLTGMLADAMEHLETNFASGVYDAAAMPLVEEFLAEMRNLALIQVERNAIIAERISDVKEANSIALEAVFAAREERSRKIQDRYDAAQERWRRKQADKEAPKEAKRMKKLLRVAEEQELSNLESARKVRHAAQEEAERQRASVQRSLDESRRTMEAEIQANERRRASFEAVTKAEQRMQEEYDRLNTIREELDREMNDARRRKDQYVALDRAAGTPDEAANPPDEAANPPDADPYANHGEHPPHSDALEE